MIDFDLAPPRTFFDASGTIASPMIEQLARYFRDAHWERQHGWRHRLWQAANRLGLTGIHGLPIARDWVEVHERPMPLPHLDAGHVGLRLVQLSDLHYSPFVWSGYLRQQLRVVNDLKPDLIVITGDLISGGYRWLDRIARILSHLSAPRGVIVTLGNHDYSMWGKSESAEGKRRAKRLANSLSNHGLRILRNETEHLAPLEGGPPLAIVGLDDEWSGHLDADRAFASVAPDQPTICLNHNPINARELLRYPWHYMLAGHTHGRPLAVSKFGKWFHPHRFRHFTHGHYLIDGRHLYVNRGLSYGQRARHWCRPEITVFTLERAAST